MGREASTRIGKFEKKGLAAVFTREGPSLSEPPWLPPINNLKESAVSLALFPTAEIPWNSNTSTIIHKTLKTAFHIFF